MVRNNDDKTKDRTILGKDVTTRDILLAAMKQIDTELGALLVQLYQSSVTVDNAEKNPVNVKELGALTADDIPVASLVTVYSQLPPLVVPLTPAELLTMFDKDPNTYYTIPAVNPGDDEVAKMLIFGLKTPFDIKRLLFMDPGGYYITLVENSVYVITFTPDRNHEGDAHITQPITIDEAINKIYFINTSLAAVTITEIIGTIFHPTEVFPQDPDGLPIKSPPEHQPINVQEMPELIPEAIREVEIYPYAEMIGFVEKNIPTEEEHIGFVQKGYEDIEEHVGFIEKGYFERFIGYSEKPKTISQRFIGFSEKPTTVTPRFIGYSEKPTTVTPRFMGYGERPAPEVPPVEGEPVWYNEIYINPA